MAVKEDGIIDSKVTVLGNIVISFPSAVGIIVHILVLVAAVDEVANVVANTVLVDRVKALADEHEGNSISMALTVFVITQELEISLKHKEN